MQYPKPIHFEDLITYLEINNIEYDKTLEKQTRCCIVDYINDSITYSLMNWRGKHIATIVINETGVTVLDFRKKKRH